MLVVLLIVPVQFFAPVVVVASASLTSPAVPLLTMAKPLPTVKVLLLPYQMPQTSKSFALVIVPAPMLKAEPPVTDV